MFEMLNRLNHTPSKGTNATIKHHERINGIITSRDGHRTDTRGRP